MANDTFAVNLAVARRLAGDLAATPIVTDAQLAVIGTPILRALALMESPRLTQRNGAQTGLLYASGGSSKATTSETNYGRILALRAQAASTTNLDGNIIRYVSRELIDFERSNDNAQSLPTPNLAHWYRNVDGSWTVLIYPSYNPVSGAASLNLSADVELEVADLASGVSSVPLSPSLSALFSYLLGAELARELKRDPDFISGIMQQVPDQKLLAQWNARETSRGNHVHGGPRG
jgi:hypothetical protein